MAQYQINYTCGHRDTVQLYGPEAKRQAYIAWAQSHAVCRACYDTAKAADVANVIAEAESAHALCALTGSDKQISWAREIRAVKAREIMSWIDHLRGKVKPNLLTQFDAQVDDLLALIFANNDSKYWIDNRKLSAREIAAQHRSREV